MRNEFLIKANGKEYKAFNTIRQAFNFWLMGMAYASYMAIEDSTGNRVYKQTELVSYNDDVSKGELYATYRVEVLRGEFSGVIKRIGFAPSAQSAFSNVCTTSITAAQFEVYGTVYLEPSNQEFTFYPAENPLVKSLLGICPLGEMTVKGASAHLPPWPLRVDQSLYSDVPFEYIEYNGLSISFSSSGYTDFLVFCDTKPCARFNLAYFNATQVERHMDVSGSCFVEDIDVTSVTPNNVPFSTYNTVSALYESGAPVMSGFEDYELICDPLFKHAALHNNKEYYVVDSDALTVRYGGKCNYYLCVCSDGEIVSYDKLGNLQLLRSGKKLRVASGNVVALYRDGGYDIFVKGDWILHIYRYEGEMVHTYDLDTYGEGEMFRLNDYSVIVKGRFGIDIFTADGLSECEFAWKERATSELVLDGCTYTHGYVCSLVSGQEYEANYFCNRFFVVNDELYYVSDGGAVKLKEDFQFDSAAIAGSVAIFLYGGELSFYRIAVGGTVISAHIEERCEISGKTWNDQGGTITLTIND